MLEKKYYSGLGGEKIIWMNENLYNFFWLKNPKNFKTVKTSLKKVEFWEVYEFKNLFPWSGRAEYKHKIKMIYDILKEVKE